MSDSNDRELDDLIDRLRQRAADASRRVDTPVSAFTASVSSLSLGDLLSAGRSAAFDLQRVVQANQEGRIEPDLVAKADRIETAMSTPAQPDLPSPVTAAAVEQAERALGVALPIVVRRLYTEVADGGFGPGTGLLSLEAAVEAYRELRTHEPGPRGQVWPEGLVPLIHFDPGYDCVEASTGRVVTWDPEGLTERAGLAAWRRTFSESAPSVEAWLGKWLDTKPFEERMAEQVQASMVAQARASRAAIAAKTPEERAAMGLPEVGWERIVWGGLGLDEDEGAG